MAFHRIGNISYKHDWIPLYPGQIEDWQWQFGGMCAVIPKGYPLTQPLWKYIDII